jgi:hypothetical protein
MSLLVAGGASAKIDPKTAVGIWLFDEGKGEVASDSSGNGNDGKILGAKWGQGKFGKALEFNGVDNWVSVPHSATLGFRAGTSFTITVYFKGTKVGGALVGKNYEDTTQALPWYLLWDDGTRNQITLYLRDEAGTSYRADSTSIVADDKWHLIAGVADASKGVNSIWIDSKKEGEINFNKGSGYGTTEGVLHIGRHYDRYTNGIIDEVAIFSVALTEGDIQDIMKDGLDKTALAVVSPGGKLATTWGTIKNR